MHKTFLFMKRKVSFLFIWKIQKLGHRSVIHILLKFRYEKLFLPHHTFHITTFWTSKSFPPWLTSGRKFVSNDMIIISVTLDKLWRRWSKLFIYEPFYMSGVIQSFPAVKGTQHLETTLWRMAGINSSWNYLIAIAFFFAGMVQQEWNSI